MMQFNVRSDVREVERMLRGLEKNAVPVAASRALNKVIKSAESAVAKHLASDIGVTQSEARKHLKIIRSTRTNLITAIEARGRRIPLYQLKARQVGKRVPVRDERGRFSGGKSGRGRGGGVTYRGQDGARGFVPGGFVARMKTGHVGVFTRNGDGRLPIAEKFGPSVPHVFIKRAAMSAMYDTASARWRDVFEHELQYELSKIRGL